MIGPKIPLTLSQHMVTGMMDVQSFLWVLGHRPPRRQCTALSEKAHTLEHMEVKAPLQSSCHPPAQGDSSAPLTCDLQGITIGKTRIPCETQAWVSQNAVAAYQLPHQLARAAQSVESGQGGDQEAEPREPHFPLAHCLWQLQPHQSSSCMAVLLTVVCGRVPTKEPSWRKGME